MDTITTTPTTPTEAAPAAPATSAPASFASPSERPQTMQEAFSQDAPVPETPTASTDPAATGPAATTPENGSPSPVKQGPIPFEAHKTALENARTKAATEAVQQFERDYGWAKQVSPQQFQEFAGVARQMSADPVGFLETFAAQIRDHPVYGPQLRSQAARTLASRQVAQPPEPDVQITDANGVVVGRTYSDAALAKRDEWLTSKIVTQLQGEIAPLKQTHAEQEAARQHAEAVQQIETQADAVMADITAIVGDDPTVHQAVLQAMEEHPDWTPHHAAAHVHQTVVRPKFEASAQSQVLDTLKTKAAASTINPSAAVVSTTKRPTSLLDKDLVW